MTRAIPNCRLIAATALRAAVCGISALLLAACDVAIAPDEDSRSQQYRARIVSGGNPEQGRALIASGAHGCAACHRISQIKNARGIVGPRLDGFARQAYIAGVSPNEPGQLTTFLQNPPGIAAGTAMPVLGLTYDEARDLAAYLYTLREDER